MRHLRELRPPRSTHSFGRSQTCSNTYLPDRDRVLSFCHILEVGERPPDAVQDRSSRSFGRATDRSASTAAEQLRREGDLRGQRRTLLRLLRVRFESAEVEQRILSADEAMDHWTDRVVTAATTEDVLGS